MGLNFAYECEVLPANRTLGAGTGAAARTDYLRVNDHRLRDDFTETCVHCNMRLRCCWRASSGRQRLVLLQVYVSMQLRAWHPICLICHQAPRVFSPAVRRALPVLTEDQQHRRRLVTARPRGSLVHAVLLSNQKHRLVALQVDRSAAAGGGAARQLAGHGRAVSGAGLCAAARCALCRAEAQPGGSL